MSYNEQFLQYNLQFFAQDGPGGEKTENATGKKLGDVRNEGQVAKSKDLVNAIILLAFFLSLRYAMGYVGEKLIDSFKLCYDMIPEFLTGGLSVATLQPLMIKTMLYMIVTLAPFFIIGVFVAFFGNRFQIKWKVTTKPIKPKFNKINPISGFKRMFSLSTLMELIKSLLKIAAISYIVYDTISKQAGLLYDIYDMNINNAMALLDDIIISLGIKISILLLIIGFADLIYQRVKFKKHTKMSKQEVKDEYKNSEGDPKVKAQQKQRMMQAAQRRMMANIPKADVIITNPTHFAVALQYEPGTGKAPYVVAKGADFLAAKIKDIGRDNKIEIVENKKIARMLYYNVNIGDEIPEELYKSVAEIIAYVYQVKQKVM